jgi:hypothetical protein
MSWLSSLFDSGPSSQQILSEGLARQASEQAAERARQDEEAARRRDADLQQQYFNYLESIRGSEQAKEDALAAKDPTATRQAALTSLGGIFGPEFETQYAPSTLTDPFEQQVYGEQRAEAEDVISNMLKRGVITDTGAGAARGELDTQSARVRSQLNDIGETLLGAERGKLSGIAGRAREAASNLGVGQPFDINPYQSALNTETSTFGSGLSDMFRANIPGDLFDVSGLGAIAGGAQGAGKSQVFDPGLEGPIAGKTDETDPFAGQKPVQKRTATVF